jgi:hypothetical protein
MVITSIDLGEIIGTILIANVKTSTKIKGIEFCNNKSIGNNKLELRLHTIKLNLVHTFIVFQISK